MAKRKQNTNFKSVDLISKELDVVDNFLLRHWKLYIYIAIGIVIIVAAVLIVSDYNNSLSKQAISEIESATTVQTLQTVIKKYPDSELTKYSRLKLASILVNENKYKEAAKVYNELGKGNLNTYPVSIAKVNEAYIIEKLGNKKQAAEQLAVLTKEDIPLTVRCQAEYAAGRIYYELGDMTKAKNFLQKAAAVSQQECAGWPQLADSLLNRIN
ncbi:MAG: tetratricopeptide repeat protein [bacterium]|nr:tetratricopeptide repeat protein [bacterium]